MILHLLRRLRTVDRRLRRAALSALASLHADKVAAEALHYNDFFFRELGVDKAAVDALCAQTLIALGDVWDPLEESVHYRAFAALKLAGFAPRSVLELGTYEARATQFLSALFPEAAVHTVDLPPDDPIFANHHGVDAAKQEVIARRLDRPNIVRHRVNTAFLPTLALPEQIDLIWLDAGHEFPEVAWDHFFCLSKLAPGGWLLTDDVRRASNPLFFGYPSAVDVLRVLQYFDARQPDKFRLLLKRDDARWYVVDRKYVGVLHRKEQTA